MPAAELALAGFDTGITCVKLLVYIIQTTEKVRELSSECDEVRQTSQMLLDILNNNAEALKDQETALGLQNVLNGLSEYATICQKDNLVTRMWEVMWRRKLPSLLKAMMKWVALLTMETTVELRSNHEKDNQVLSSVAQNLRSLMKDLPEQHALTGQVMTAMTTRLDTIQYIIDKRDEKKAPNLEINFKEDDKRLELTKQDGVLIGTLSDDSGEVVDVACEPVKVQLATRGEKSVRSVHIYSKICSRTLVKPFYGICEREGRLWGVFKDLRQCSTLAVLIEKENLPKSLVDRLSLACEVARTMEYLHSIRLLLKSLSDTTIVIFTENGTSKPYITGLETAREFQEDTCSRTQDVRYEVPEYPARPNFRHSPATDIWSLGIIIWQFVFTKFPFGKKRPVEIGEEVASIRESVARGNLCHLSSRSSDPLANEALGLIRECCSRTPAERPPAAQVVIKLDNMIARADAGVAFLSPDETRNDSEVRQRASSAIRDKKRVENADIHALQRFVERGDATSAFLLGLALARECIAEDQIIGDEQFLMLAAKEAVKERRVRAAIRNLEIAMHAGQNQAAADLAKMHEELRDMYLKEADCRTY